MDVPNVNSAETPQSLLYTAAARLSTPKFDGIAPTLHDDLQRLPVPHRITYKHCTLMRHYCSAEPLRAVCAPVAAAPCDLLPLLHRAL